MKVDRKTVTRNIMELGGYFENTGYELGYDITVRKIPIKKNGTDEYLTPRTDKDGNIRPFEDLNEAHGGRLDLNSYMREHVYMYSGENRKVTFRIPKSNGGL